MQKYAINVKFITQDEKRDELLNYLLEAAGGMENLETCNCYIVGINEEEKNAVYVYEVWESKAAHQASLTIPASQELIKKAKPMIVGMESYPELSIVGGKAKL